MPGGVLRRTRPGRCRRAGPPVSESRHRSAAGKQETPAIPTSAETRAHRSRRGTCPWARRSTLLRSQDEMAAPVAAPARLVVLGADRRLLAPAHHDEALRRNTETDEVFPHGIGAALAKRQVV